jgi:hypothetical protein
MRFHKYYAKPTVVDGIKFPSQGEAKRWCLLKVLERAGKIQGLERQRAYPLHAPLPDGGKACIGSYVCDFLYTEDGREIIEDFKGYPTPEYRWKKRHFETEYGKQIVEVRR